jgi:hypothetical protein
MRHDRESPDYEFRPLALKSPLPGLSATLVGHRHRDPTAFRKNSVNGNQAGQSPFSTSASSPPLAVFLRTIVSASPDLLAVVGQHAVNSYRVTIPRFFPACAAKGLRFRPSGQRRPPMAMKHRQCPIGMPGVNEQRKCVQREAKLKCAVSARRRDWWRASSTARNDEPPHPHTVGPAASRLSSAEFQMDGRPKTSSRVPPARRGAPSYGSLPAGPGRRKPARTSGGDSGVKDPDDIARTARGLGRAL